MNWDELPMMLTVKQAQPILGVCERRVYMLIEEGELPHKRYGKRQIRIPREPLRQYLEGQAVNQ